MTEKYDPHELAAMSKPELAKLVTSLYSEILALKQRFHIPPAKKAADVAPGEAIFKPLDMPDPGNGGY